MQINADKNHNNQEYWSTGIEKEYHPVMITLPAEHRVDYKNKPTSATSKDIRHVDHSETTQSIRRDNTTERRRMPDRRKKHSEVSCTEKRRINDRRSPLLLNATSAKPEQLYSRKGTSINITA